MHTTRKYSISKVINVCRILGLPDIPTHHSAALSRSIRIIPAHTATVRSPKRAIRRHGHLCEICLLDECLLDACGLDDEVMACPLEGVGGVGRLVGLEFEGDVVFERMGDFVACE
jgi:hypothetical protein